MTVGILKETWVGEGRVAGTPSAARALVDAGHVVLVEQNAGAASGLADDEYIRAGAEIAPSAEEIFDRVDAVWKVLPPSAHEAGLLRAGQTLLCLWHAGGPLAPRALPDGVRLVALERHGAVLAAMSEIAGRLAVVTASQALQRPNASGVAGRGLFLGGVPGVEAANVVVVGAGTAGACAAALATAMGANVRVLDTDVERLRALGRTATLIATPHAVERALAMADVVIAAVRSRDGTRPLVAGRAHLALMQPGSVIVDLSIADGGAFASTPVTTLEEPVEPVDGILHVGVPNFAGAVPRTASVALSQAALPWVLGAVSDQPSAISKKAP
jgi:alanine dehydrogenase